MITPLFIRPHLLLLVTWITTGVVAMWPEPTSAGIDLLFKRRLPMVMPPAGPIHSPGDTARVHALLDSCLAATTASDYAKAQAYLDSGSQLARQLDYTAGIMRGHNHQGLVHYYKGSLNEALTEFLLALDLARQLGSRQKMADNHTNIGMVYGDLGEYEQAIVHYTLALDLRDPGDKRGISAAYTNLGVVHYSQGNYTRALDYFLRSLDMDRQLDDPLDLAASLNNVGLFYEMQGNHKAALKYYAEALSLYRAGGRQDAVAGVTSNMGNLCMATGDLDSALIYYLEALRIAEERGNTQNVAMLASNIGSLYLQQGAYASAKENLELALRMDRDLDRKREIASDLFHLGILYRTLGQYGESRASLREGLSISREIGTIEKTISFYREISSLDSIVGDFPSSLANYKLHVYFTDSLTRQNNEALMREMQGKFETAEKDREITRLSAEKEMQRLNLRLQGDHLALLQAQKDKLDAENALHVHALQALEDEKRMRLLEGEKQQKDLILARQAGELVQHRSERQRILRNVLLAGLALTILLSLITFGYLRTRHRLKLQTLRNKIASDLHDEVGSTLSSIAIFAEVAQLESKDVIPMLGTIRDNSRKMLDAMGDIVWTINPENDQFEKIILRMRNFAFDLLGAKKIDFEFIAHEDVSDLRLPMEVRKNLFLIFKEAANNLAKYAEADKARFTILEEDGELKMSIVDNGRGFNPEQPDYGNGLANMKARAKEIGALLRIQSAPGHGTRIDLQLTL